MQNLKRLNIESMIPTYDQLMWPTLKALKDLGGSGSNQEILDKIIELEGYPEEVQNFTPEGKTMSMLDYRCAWARSYLKKAGAINNSTRGVWVILDEGETLTEKDMKDIPSLTNKVYLEEKKNKHGGGEQNRRADQKAFDAGPAATSVPDLEEDDARELWYEALLETLGKIDPSAFERLCQRILRESGFTKVEVTGKVGDGGIDGKGILRVNLISFHVYFQSKRWKGSVGSGEIRNFRGAITGRADKGLFITTGTFTADARKEAIRDGGMAIDLIDGHDLCDLIKKLKLGVTTETIEKVNINTAWFEEL